MRKIETAYRICELNKELPAFAARWTGIRFRIPIFAAILLCSAIVIFGQPTVTNVTSTVANGTYGVGAVIPITVQFSEAVTVTGIGFIQLALQLSAHVATVSYTSGSGTSTLTFNYTVAAGDTSSHLDYAATTSLSLLYGATIMDAATGTDSALLILPAPGAAGSLGANKTIVITYTPVAPTVTNVTSTVANGIYSVGAVIPITVQFSEAVTVMTGSNGKLQLDLQIPQPTGGIGKEVNYTSGSGTSTLTFNYIVASGDTSSHLDYMASNPLWLYLDATVMDAATGTVNAVLALPAPGAAGSLGANKVIAINVVPPAAPTVTNVTSTAADGTYGVGALIPITLQFSESVLVTGIPTLTLETGTNDAVVNYSSGSGTSVLTFNYTVASGDTSSHLDYTATTALALAGGTIKDANGNAAILTLAAPGAAGSLGANKAIVVAQASTSAIRSLSTGLDFRKASGKARVINYTLATDQQVSLSVYDLQGRAVVTLDKACKAGAYSMSLGNLTAGSYIVAFKAGEYRRMARFIME